MSDKFYLTWADIERDTLALIKDLPRDRYDGILAVTRGGLIPAGMISQHLDITVIETIGLVSYHGQAQTAVKVTKSPKIPEDDHHKWLIVDELVDTGATVNYLRQHFPNSDIAAVYAKPKGHGIADYTGIEFDESRWLVFPWETDAQNNPQKNL